MNDDSPKSYLPWINELVRNHKDWTCHGGGNGTPGGNGKSLEFTWQGTKLGVRVEGEANYLFTELKGANGETPHIDTETKHWFVGNIDTGVSAEGLRGADGKIPAFKIGTITTLPEGEQATATISGTAKEPVLNLGIPRGATGNPASNTDEKVKLSSASTQAKYLSEYVDGQTIVIDPSKNQMVVQTIQGLQTTVTTLNFIKNLDKDIMTYLNAISNPMQFREVLPTDAALNAVTGSMVGDTYIVKESESNNNKTMTYIYNGTDYAPIAETTIEVRDFSTNPLNLATESTGTLPESKIDFAIARKSSVLDKDTYAGSADGVVKKADALVGLSHTPTEVDGLFEASHRHLNKPLLDSLIATGDGKGFLNNKGEYMGIFWVSSAEPENTGILWIDDTDEAKPVLKFHNGTEWVPISSSMDDIPKITVDDIISDSSENPVQNKVIKEYVDGKETKISKDAENAIVNHEDGIYVKDNTEQVDLLEDTVDTIQRHRKYVNTKLDYCSLGFRHDADVLTTSFERSIQVPLNSPIPFDECQDSHGMEYDLSDHTITLKAGKTYLLYGQSKTLYSQVIDHVIRFYNVTDGTYLNNSATIRTSDESGCIEEVVTPIKDIKVSLNVAYVSKGQVAPMRVGYFTNTGNGIGISPQYKMINEVFFIATEIGRAITVDPLDYVNTESGIEDTPIGTIIPVMATAAPAHYLPCTGEIVNIADYPYLAEHFKSNFGTYNYFGGNGTTTFATPDLRGEFLRGSGAASRQTGEGGEIGSHQDPTRVPHFQTHKNGSDRWIGAFVPNGDCYPSNIEQETKDSAFIVYCNGSINTQPSYVNKTTSYTTRPTNTAVLYCIKAEPTYFMKVEGKDCYSTEKHMVGYWVDGKPLYEKTVIVQGAAANVTTKTPHNITNIDVIFVASGSVFLGPNSSGTEMEGSVIPFCNASQANSIGAWVSTGYVFTEAGINRQGRTYYINIRWTEK